MSYVQLNYNYTINNNNFEAPRSFHNFNRNIVLLFSNNVPANKLVLVTGAALGNGSPSIVLFSIVLSTKGLSISKKNRSMSIKSTQQKKQCMISI